MADRVLQASGGRLVCYTRACQVLASSQSQERLTQVRRKDEVQRSVKLSQLEGGLNGLERKDLGSAASMAAMQTQTCMLLHHRQPGDDSARPWP